MTRYHVNPETNRPNICNAKIRCDFAVDGQEPPHFDNKADAKAYAEKSLTEEHGATKAVKKTVKKVDEPVKTNGSLFSATHASYTVPERKAVDGGGYGGNAWVGSKRPKEGWIGTTEIAKNVREDIKEATHAGYLPQGFKYSLKVDKFAGGSAIRTKIYGASDILDTHDVDTRWGRLVPNADYRELVNRVSNLIDAYNYNDSDAQTDYFNTAFYSTVEIASASDEKLKENESQKRKFNNFLKSKNIPDNAKNYTPDAEFLEAEKEYYGTLHEYFSAVNYENEVYEFVREYSRKPDAKEVDVIKKAAERKADERIDSTKKRHEKNGTRFLKRT